MKLDTNNNNHAVFKLNYHLIMVVKYRRKVIDNTISTRLKTIFEDIGDIGEKYHITVKEWNQDIDHVHVLLTAKTQY